MRYLSLFSGIEAASAAWHDLGWTPIGFSEIEPFPCAVLAHRFPNVRNYGDVTKYKEWGIEPGSVDLVVGGSPCQAFSVAGLRKGLDDPRGNLTLTYLGVVAHLRPRWVVWENVPGVLSIDGGRVLGAFLGALGQLGYRWAYRVLDAQHFGVPQRRRRIFVVASLGDGAHPGSVLFEQSCLRGNPAKGHKTRKGSASSAGAGVDECGLQRTVGTLCADTHPGAYSGQDAYTGRLIPHATDLVTQPNGSHWDSPTNPHPTLNRGGMGQIGYSNQEIFSQRGGGLVPHSEIYPIQDGREMQKAQNGLGISDANVPAYTLDTTGAQAVAVCATQDAHDVAARAFGLDIYNQSISEDLSPTLQASSGGNSRAHAVVAFEPRYYTRENKTGGAPTQTPTLTASAWKAGDAAPTVAVCDTGSVTHALRAEGADASEDGTGRGTPIVPVAFDGYPTSGQGAELNACPTDVANAVTVTEHARQTDRGTRIVQPIGLDEEQNAVVDGFGCLKARTEGGGFEGAVMLPTMQVRRLTPTECERLQGFPDGWTDIPFRNKPAADGPRYKALGNSMAVPVMRWIGQRIQLIGGGS